MAKRNICLFFKSPVFICLLKFIDCQESGFKSISLHKDCKINSETYPEIEVL
jgi:hypothetical protein